MAAFDFPSSPNVNDIYTLNGVAFMWNGFVWKRYSTSTGAQGFQGAAGATGAQGAQGTNGTIGSDGAQGAAGAQGATGSGATGAQGAAGAQGATGAAGAQGAPFDRSEYNYTASGGQTAFPAAYANASDVDVFMNGVRLTPAEYTPSGGTTITLASGATAGDIIDILTFASAGPTGAQGAQGHQGDAFSRSESNFTATSGQTSFAPSGGYTNGDDLDVFVNGVRLTPADYTATNGTNVVLDVGANTGDIVDIIYYEAAGPAGAQGAAGAAGIAGTITFSTSAPSNPIMGDLWYDTDDGAFAGYYNDGNTSQWIDLSGGPRGAQGADGAQGAASLTINNNANNRVITGDSNASTLNGEANLTFDGSTLSVTGGASFTGNVSIGGTLTYEDVTNIDAVGFVTARSGIRVLAGGANIVGATTATSFVKTGGTSSQFLKADGSVDSSSYITNIGISSAGSSIGNATTLNFIGAGNTFAVNGSTIDISIAGGGGGGGGGANVNISTSTPSSPSSGDLWWDSDDGGMNIYYDDGNTSQWVEVSTGPTGAQGDTGSAGAAGAQGAQGAQGTNGNIGVDGDSFFNYDSVGVNTTRQLGINTTSTTDPDLVGIGNSFQGMYVSNGMIIYDNTLNGNHYIGTNFNGLMAGPVTINGTLSVDGNYVVV